VLFTDIVGSTERASSLGDRERRHLLARHHASVRRGARFALSGGGRRIVLRFDAGYPCGQIYAPEDDDVICFEPMTAPTNALVSGDRLTWVPAGSSYTATFSISVT